MRRNKGFVLVATAACLASASLSKADIGLLTSLADWGGSAYAPGGFSNNGVQNGAAANQNPGAVPAGQPEQFGNQGVGYYVSGNGTIANIDANADTVINSAGAATTNITTNGLFNLNNDFAASNTNLDQPTIGTSWQGFTGGVGGTTITGYPGGVDTVSTGELLPGGSTNKIATTLQAGTAFALDFTTPLGGTTLASAGYYSVAMVGNTSTAAGYARFFTGNGDGTLATKNNAATYSGDSYGDQGSFIVNNGTYYTAYLPYNQGAAQTANTNVPNNINFSALTSLQLEPEVNADGADYGTGGNINFSNLRLVTPTWAPVTTTVGVVAGNTSGSWTLNSSTIDTNWIGGLPDAAGVSATFSGLVTGNATVTLDAQQTVGSIVFNNSTYSYTIAPGTGGSLVLDNSTATPAANASISDLGGAHSITAPITLNTTTTVSVVNSADSLTLSGNINGAGGLTVGPLVTVVNSIVENNTTYTASTTTANTGTTIISGTNSFLGAITVSSGTLKATTHTAVPSGAAMTVASGGKFALAIGAGDITLSSLGVNGTFDIANNRAVINSDTTAEATGLIAALHTGHATNWAGPNGVVSSAVGASVAYGVAFGEGTVVHGLASGNIELSYALYGDINQDGSVNGTDFGILASNFGKSVTGGWEQGDLNYDGAVTGADFALLAQNFGKSSSGVAINLPASDWTALDSFASANGLLADVPEPASLSVLGVVGMGLVSRRRRK